MLRHKVHKLDANSFPEGANDASQRRRKHAGSKGTRNSISMFSYYLISLSPKPYTLNPHKKVSPALLAIAGALLSERQSSLRAEPLSRFKDSSLGKCIFMMYYIRYLYYDVIWDSLEGNYFQRSMGGIHQAARSSDLLSSFEFRCSLGTGS